MGEGRNSQIGHGFCYLVLASIGLCMYGRWTAADEIIHRCAVRHISGTVLLAHHQSNVRKNLHDQRRFRQGGATWQATPNISATTNLETIYVHYVSNCCEARITLAWGFEPVRAGPCGFSPPGPHSFGGSMSAYRWSAYRWTVRVSPGAAGFPALANSIPHRAPVFKCGHRLISA